MGYNYLSLFYVRKSNANERETEYRYTRVLVYQGPREWIDGCIKDRSIKECYQVAQNKVIYEASMLVIPENDPIHTSSLLVWINNKQQLSYGEGDFERGYLEALNQMSMFIRSQ